MKRLEKAEDEVDAVVTSFAVELRDGSLCDPVNTGDVDGPEETGDSGPVAGFVDVAVEVVEVCLVATMFGGALEHDKSPIIMLDFAREVHVGGDDDAVEVAQGHGVDALLLEVEGRGREHVLQLVGELEGAGFVDVDDKFVLAPDGKAAEDVLLGVGGFKKVGVTDQKLEQKQEDRFAGTLLGAQDDGDVVYLSRPLHEVSEPKEEIVGASFAVVS